MTEILEAESWQMTLGERAALEGLLSQLRPQLAIEIGTAEGGSLRHISSHSEWVHSFDLVHSTVAEELPNVTPHVGDSHVLLPKVLDELAQQERNVEFVLVDGDHTADGVERDMLDLLSSDAIRRTLIVVHDTMNDEVRAGLKRIDYAANPKVVLSDLDLVGGHLSFGGPFHHQLWGGLGLVVVDDRGQRTSFRSTVLLKLVVLIGFVIALIGLGLAAFEIIAYFVAPEKTVPGYTSLAVLMLVLTGVIIFSVGIVGLYVGRVFEQVKDRPLFLIDQEAGHQARIASRDPQESETTSPRASGGAALTDRVSSQ